MQFCKLSQGIRKNGEKRTRQSKFRVWLAGDHSWGGKKTSKKQANATALEAATSEHLFCFPLEKRDRLQTLPFSLMKLLPWQPSCHIRATQRFRRKSECFLRTGPREEAAKSTGGRRNKHTYQKFSKSARCLVAWLASSSVKSS